jgi:phosphate:Na+ symporter
MDIRHLVKGTIEHNLQFTKEANEELKQIESMVLQMFENTIEALKNADPELSRKTAELEDEVDRLSEELQNNHIKRLDEGSCSVESGVVFLDIVNHFERIADHIYKISLLTTDELQGLARSDS